MNQRRISFLAVAAFAAAVLLSVPSALAASFQVDTNGTLTTSLVSYYSLESTSTYMDEVRVWDSERSALDITTNWIKEATSTTGMRGLWHFNGTSTEAVTSNATSGQVGAPTFGIYSPFGHFIENQLYQPTPATGGQMLWYPSGTLYSSYVASGSALWTANGGLTIASTTSVSNANVIVSDVNSSDISWAGLTTFYVSTSTRDTIQFNEYQMETSTVNSTMKLDLATHELGHALGLDHSFIGNIMNYYTPSPGRTTLGTQDIIDYTYLRGQHLWGN
jgi:hypothetical protein